MSSWTGGGGGSFESRMNCEWIERQSRREEEEVGRVLAGWKETVATGGKGESRGGGGGGVRGLVEWPELDSTWTTYFYIAREIMGFPSWSGFPLGAAGGHRCTRQEILHHHPRRILSVSCSRPTFIVAGPPSLVHLSDQPHLYPVSQLDVPAWFSRNQRYFNKIFINFDKRSFYFWKVHRISNDIKDREQIRDQTRIVVASLPNNIQIHIISNPRHYNQLEKSIYSRNDNSWKTRGRGLKRSWKSLGTDGCLVSEGGGGRGLHLHRSAAKEKGGVLRAWGATW